MSPNTGEPEHESSGWTHRICVGCFGRLRGGVPPARVSGDTLEPCCYCGTLTAAGIYVRQAADEVHAVTR
jgi:hypothetical protein